MSRIEDFIYYKNEIKKLVKERKAIERILARKLDLTDKSDLIHHLAGYEIHIEMAPNYSFIDDSILDQYAKREPNFPYIKTVKNNGETIYED